MLGALRGLRNVTRRSDRANSLPPLPQSVTERLRAEEEAELQDPVKALEGNANLGRPIFDSSSMFRWRYPSSGHHMR